MRRINPAVLAAVFLSLILLVAAVTMMTRRGNAPQDKLSDEQATGTGATAPQSRCARQATYDRIKTELFRQAAKVRGSDQSAFDRLSSYAAVRVERPLLRSQDDALGTLRCTGHLSLDLPPGVAVVGGRRTLSADVDYVLQPAADGSGDVVMLEGADPIVVPLATFARPARPPQRRLRRHRPLLASAVSHRACRCQGPRRNPSPNSSQGRRRRSPFGEASPSSTAATPAPAASWRFAAMRGWLRSTGNGRDLFHRAVASADAGAAAILARTGGFLPAFRDNCSEQRLHRRDLSRPHPRNPRHHVRRLAPRARAKH